MLPLSACTAGGGGAPRVCEPNEAVTTTLSGIAEAGVSDGGFVTDVDVDLTIAVAPAGTSCR